jgi:hypothetical protein
MHDTHPISEPLPKAKRSRRYRRDERWQLVQAWHDSGQSQAEFAAGRGIALKTMSRWVSECRRESTGGPDAGHGFVPAEPPSLVGTSADGMVVWVLPRGLGSVRGSATVIARAVVAALGSDSGVSE